MKSENFHSDHNNIINKSSLACFNLVILLLVTYKQTTKIHIHELDNNYKIFFFPSPFFIPLNYIIMIKVRFRIFAMPNGGFIGSAKHGVDLSRYAIIITRLIWDAVLCIFMKERYFITFSHRLFVFSW